MGQSILSFFQRILNWIKERLGIISKQINELPKPIPIDQPPPPPAPPISKYDWSTPELARHSVRVICDEEGLSVEMKNKLTETIKCESGFNPKAVGTNQNGTKDYGIIQFLEDV